MTRAGTVFFTGKGGVGKTTCALAVARVASRSRPVVIVSLDPAHNVGDLCGVRLGTEPREIGARLRACEPDLDALGRERSDRAVDLVRSGYRHLDSLGLGGLPSLIRHAPGLAEQAAVDALACVHEDADEEEMIVVDMPPTGLAARTLALPALQLEWMDVLGKLRRRILDRRASIAHVRGREYLERARGVEGLPIVEESDPVMSELSEERRAAERMRRLVSNEARHVLVVNPEELSLNEAARLRGVLRDLGTDGSLVVMNRRREGEPACTGPGLEGIPVVQVPRLQAPRSVAALDSVGEIIVPEL